MPAEKNARQRVYHGGLERVLPWLLVVWTIGQCYYTTIGVLPAMHLRLLHAGCLLCFAFCYYPTHRREERVRSFPPVWDIFAIILTIGGIGYLFLQYNRFAASGGRGKPLDLWVAGLVLCLVLEAARRVAGNLAMLALFFLSYQYWGVFLPGGLGHTGFSLRRVLLSQVWGTGGIFGIGLGVSATYIFLFVLFGALLRQSGFSQFLNDLSLTLVGRSSGGAAKVSVVASALLGMINGSAVANVATTGTITIPLMKKSGYSAEWAAAVEATASTGGQFCPPIMGAVGFVMAEFLGISYTQVMLAAIVPAFLYYLGILAAVHLQSKRLGLEGLPSDELPEIGTLLRKNGQLFTPFLLLIGLMLAGQTPLRAAAWAMAATVAVSYLRPETRLTGKRLMAAACEGAKAAIGVGICCLVIGVIIGTVTLTGLGLQLGYLILDLVAEGSIYLTGLLVLLMSVILGMGVPGVAAYVIVEAVAVPVLIKVGVLPLAAHLFCLIYACLSNITPPVAMSSYVAAGIAEASETKTSLLAMRIGLVGFVLPFFFLDNPTLLLGSGAASLGKTIQAVLTATLGTLAFVAGSEGWLRRKCSVPERIALLLAALGLMHPGSGTDLVGLGLCMFVWIWQRKDKVSPSKEL